MPDHFFFFLVPPACRWFAFFFLFFCPPLCYFTLMIWWRWSCTSVPRGRKGSTFLLVPLPWLVGWPSSPPPPFFSPLNSPLGLSSQCEFQHAVTFSSRPCACVSVGPPSLCASTLVRPSPCFPPVFRIPQSFRLPCGKVTREKQHIALFFFPPLLRACTSLSVLFSPDSLNQDQRLFPSYMLLRTCQEEL